MKPVTSLLLLLAALSPLSAAESDRVDEDEAAIRKNIESYTTAFNEGNAKSLADHWAENGVWISPTGQRTTGRTTIEKEMAAYFSATRRQHLIVSDAKIRFVTPTVAVEEGTARVSREGEPPSDTTYVAIHVKENDQWKLDTIREVALPMVTSNFEQLKALEWMIGTWVDKEGDSSIETTCKWTKNKNFMTRSFRVMIEGQIDLEGTQVVGYDAVNKQIRSWVFDTDGGVGEGVWTQHGDRWIVKKLHALPSGEKGASITIITYVDNDTFIWQSTGREVGGRLMPDIDPVTVIRK